MSSSVVECCCDTAVVECGDSANRSAPHTAEPRHRADDPSIENVDAPRQQSHRDEESAVGPSAAPALRRASARKTKPSPNSSVSPYQKPIPQSTFLRVLREREHVLQQKIAEKDERLQQAQLPSPRALGDSCTASTPEAVALRLPHTPVTRGSPKRPNESSAAKLHDIITSFPTASVKDPFCPKPPVHPSAMRLEASVATVKKLFFPGVHSSSGTPKLKASAQGRDFARPTTAPIPQTRQSRSETEDPLPVLVTSPAAQVVNTPPTEVLSPHSRDAFSSPTESEASEPDHVDGNLVELRPSLSGDPSSAEAGGRSTALVVPSVSPSRRRCSRTTSAAGEHEIEKLLHFLPKDYREPEIILKTKELLHPNDPVTGKPLPRRRYRLGFENDPANDLDPTQAAQAIRERGLPTHLSVNSTDPAVLAIVDAFIESSPGLEQVDLGSMDAKYEMVLRNIYIALSRNVSVGRVTGEFPKAASKAIHSTIHANTERREKRLDQLTAKERELRIEAMEKRILQERQETKKRTFENMRQRTKLSDRHLRSQREILREEEQAWELLLGEESESLRDVQSKELARYEWWTSSVLALEAEMAAVRLQESRTEHHQRETMRLNEVNQRLAAQIELNRIQKQQDNERHSVFADQFAARKRIRGEEKQIRRSLEGVLLDELRRYLEERALAERRRREEEVARIQEEARIHERHRKLERDQEILLVNEAEKRRVWETEGWKAYDLFRRKHFEGIVAAKNHQRLREQREKRQAAFLAADSTVARLDFRVSPPPAISSFAAASLSSDGKLSNQQQQQPVVGYKLNTVGDYMILNPNARLSVEFDSDMTPLTLKQRMLKAEQHGGYISCRIQRDDVKAIHAGLEGITLYIPTDRQQDPNIAVDGYVPREAGDILPMTANTLRNEDAAASVRSPTSRLGGAPLDSRSPNRRKSVSPSLLGKGASGAAANASPVRPQEEIEMELHLKKLCGSDRTFGVLRVRDETSEAMQRQRSASEAMKKGVGELLLSMSANPNDINALLSELAEEIESEPDSDSSSTTANTYGNSDSRLKPKVKKGFGSMIGTLESVGLAKRPKRRVVSWNDIDVAVIEIGYAGAPLEISRMVPYYNNTSTQRMRGKKSAMMRHVESMRSLSHVSGLDCSEITLPLPPANVTASSRKRTLTASEYSSSKVTMMYEASPTLKHQTTAPSFSDPSGVEVFRLRILPNAPRDALSDILAHLSYFNASGVENITRFDEDLLPDGDPLKISTMMALGFRKSCLPSTVSASPMATTLAPPSADDDALSSTTSFMSGTQKCASDMSTRHDEVVPGSGLRGHHLGLPASQLVWSTHTAQALVKFELPVFVAETQLKPVYFLEDQAPMPLCQLNKFALCLPIVSSTSSALDSSVSSSLVSTQNINMPPLSPSGYAPHNQTVGSSHVVIREHSDQTLEAMEILVGRNAVHGFHLYLSILDQSRGDVFVLLEKSGFTLGNERLMPFFANEEDIGSKLPHGRRFSARLDDCHRHDVGIEVSKMMREIRHFGEVVGFAEGMLLSERNFVAFCDHFNHTPSSPDDQTPRATALTPSAVSPSSVTPESRGLNPLGSSGSVDEMRPLRTLSATLLARDPKKAPIRIHLQSNRTVTLACFRDLITSLAYANLNKDPSPVVRHVDIAVADRSRKQCSVVRQNVTVVPVDDITEIKLHLPDCGFRIFRAPTEIRPEYLPYLPPELPFYICPDATAEDPDTLYFEGGWLEVEIVDGLKEGDVLYILQDERMSVENACTWNYDSVRHSARLYHTRQATQSSAPSGSPPDDMTPQIVLSNANFNEGSNDFSAPAVLLNGVSSPEARSITSPQSSNLLPPGGAAPQVLQPYPRVTLGVFTDDEDEPSSEMYVTSGLALEDIPPLVSRREMSRGRLSGLSSAQTHDLSTTDHHPPMMQLQPPHVTQRASGVSAEQLGHSLLTVPHAQHYRPSISETSEGDRNAGMLTYASPLLRIEFKTFSLAALQYVLRRIAFKSVAATEKNPRYFGARKIEFRAIIGDPTIPKFRKFDPFQPIVNEACVKVCEPLLKTVTNAMNYKEGQGTMGLSLGMLDAGSDGYRCFNRGYFSATIVKGATPDDRLLIRALDPSAFDYGLSMLELDPTNVFQPRRTLSLGGGLMQKSKSTTTLRVTANRDAHYSMDKYVPGAGGVGPDGEVNANFRPPPPGLQQQWVKSISTGKHKFQQWKCCELYNGERAVVGMLTTTNTEIFVGLREYDKVRKFGKVVGATTSATTSAPTHPTAAPSQQLAPPSQSSAAASPSTVAAPPTKTLSSLSKKKVTGKEKATNILAEKESRAIKVPLPDGATAIRYNDVLSLTKLLSFENRSNNPTELKKVILISLSDEWTTSHMVMEVNVQPVDDATEIRKAHNAPLAFRNGFDKAYIPLFEHCTLHDPDTEHFNGGYFHVSMAQMASEGDTIRLLSLDEQRYHRDSVLQDTYAKYRSKGAGAAKASDRSKSPRGKVQISGAGESPSQEVSGRSVGFADSLPNPTQVVVESSTKAEDPNEPYEFVFSEKRQVIYWLDRTAKLASSSRNDATGIPPPSGQFVDTGAFGSSSVPGLHHRSSAEGLSRGMIPFRVGEDGCLRRIGTYQFVAQDAPKPKTPAGRQGHSKYVKASPRPVEASQISTAPQLDVSMAVSLLKDTNESSTLLSGTLDHSHATVGETLLRSVSNPTLLSGSYLSSGVNLQIKLDNLTREDDVEEDDMSERAAPVNINMLQALTKCIVFANTSLGHKTKIGPRHFHARVGSAAGGDDGKAKVIVSVFGTLLSWIDSVVPNVIFRPRMHVIYPLQRLLFLNDLIFKCGFVMIEVSEGFEPQEDVVRLNEIGRTFSLRDGTRLVMQPKDQQIGNYQVLDTDGVPHGFLIWFDANCRVSGSILQTLCRSFSYTNSTRRTGSRRVRVTVCDGTYYETSITEVGIQVDQDEDTVPTRFGPSQGKVVYMEAQQPVSVFPDVSLTLKGFNATRTLTPPAVLEAASQTGAQLALSNKRLLHYDMEYADGKLFASNGTEMARVVMSGGTWSAAVTPRNRSDSSNGSPRNRGDSVGGTLIPVPPSQRARLSSFAGRAAKQRTDSVVSVATSEDNSRNSSTPTTPYKPSSALQQPPSSGMKGLRSPNVTSFGPPGSSGVQQPQLAGDAIEPHRLRVECIDMPMKYVEGVLRSIVFSKVANDEFPTRPVARGLSSFRSSSFRRRSVGNMAGQRQTAGASGNTTPSAAPLSGPEVELSPRGPEPTQFTLAVQLCGTTTETGRISQLSILHAESVIRVCESAVIFSLPPAGTSVHQGPGGDIFAGIHVAYVPKTVKISWRPKRAEPADNDPLAADAKQLIDETAVESRNDLSLLGGPIQLAVTTRLGLVVSANGFNAYFGKEKIATIVEDSRQAPSSRETSQHTAPMRSSTRPSHFEDKVLVDIGELSALVDAKHDHLADPLIHEETDDLDLGGSSPIFGLPRLTSSDIDDAPAVERISSNLISKGQMVLVINQSRKVTPEMVARLLRSISTFPALECTTEFTVTMEASDECATTQTLVVAPYSAACGRRSTKATSTASRGSFSAASRSVAIARRRDSKEQRPAAAVFVAERMGKERKNRK